jgi:SH3 domain-containing YSC84-like protein 1
MKRAYLPAAADTDIVMKAEVLSYSRSRGLFAGISLEGSTLRSDGSANEKPYGRKLSAKEIVRGGKVGVPASGREFIALLDKSSPKNRSDPKSLGLQSRRGQQKIVPPFPPKTSLAERVGR